MPDLEAHHGAPRGAAPQKRSPQTCTSLSATERTGRWEAAPVLSIVGACLIAVCAACSRAGAPASRPDEVPHSDGWRYCSHFGGVYTTKDLERFEPTLPPVDNIEPVYQTDL